MDKITHSVLHSLLAMVLVNQKDSAAALFGEDQREWMAIQAKEEAFWRHVASGGENIQETVGVLQQLQSNKIAFININKTDDGNIYQVATNVPAARLLLETHKEFFED